MAGFFSPVASFFTRATESSPSEPVGVELFDAIGGWGNSAAGIPVNSITAMQHTAVMTCVSILSEDIAKLPIRLMRRLPDGGKKPVHDHFLARLLRRPNDWQTRFEFIEMMQAALVLRSNAFAAIIRDSNGFPQQLIPLHPDRVSLYEAPGGDWYWAVSRQGLHEMAVLADLPILIHKDDMFHVRWLSTWHSLLGTSRVSLMREAVGLSMTQEQLAARTAGAGVHMPGYLSTDKAMTKEAGIRLLDGWNKAHGGWRNAGRTALLEQGVKWNELKPTDADVEFLKTREFQLEEIARGFRMPHFKLGLTIERGDLVQLQQMYINDVISTWCTRWVPKFEELGGVDGEEGYGEDSLFVEFDYMHLLKADILTRLTAMRLGVVGMVYTPNEARAGEGLGRVEGGDTLYQPVNVAPIGFTPNAAKPGNGPGSDQTGAPGEGGHGDPAEIPALPGDGPSPSV